MAQAITVDDYASLHAYLTQYAPTVTPTEATNLHPGDIILAPHRFGSGYTIAIAGMIQYVTQQAIIIYDTPTAEDHGYSNTHLALTDTHPILLLGHALTPPATSTPTDIHAQVKTALLQAPMRVCHFDADAYHTPHQAPGVLLIRDQYAHCLIEHYPSGGYIHDMPHTRIINPQAAPTTR